MKDKIVKKRMHLILILGIAVLIILCVSVRFFFVSPIQRNTNIPPVSDVIVHNLSYKDWKKIGSDIFIHLPTNVKVTKEGNKWWISGDTHIAIKGDHIQSISYKSEQGQFRFLDINKRNQLEKNKKLYSARFFINTENREIKEDYEQYFEKLWKHGEFDAQKSLYFKNLSDNLSDYILVFSDKYNSSNKPTYSTIFDKTVQVPPKRLVVELRTKEQNEANREIYMKSKKISFEYYDGYYNTLEWNHVAANKILSDPNIKNIDYSTLPGDNITIIIRKSDNTEQPVNISITYNKDGYMVAKIKKI